MTEYHLVLPSMGEGVMEATVTAWLKNVGDSVEEDESIVEVATDKVDSEVPSPVKGIIKEIIIPVNSVVGVEQPMAILEIENDSVEKESQAMEYQNATNHSVSQEVEPIVVQELEKPMQEAQPVMGKDISSDMYLSPLVKTVIQKENISQEELNTIHGTGKEGRITKEDIFAFLETRDQVVEPQKAKQELTSVAIKKELKPKTNQVHQTQEISLKSGDELIEMDRMRKLIANHMLHSKQTSPHVTSFVECDMTSVVNWRNSVKDKFFDMHGEKLTFMPIIVQALIKAIRDFPMINASVNGYNIIKKRDINIGMATALPNGNLIVPVVKNADQYNLTGLAKKMNDLARRARENQLNPDEVQNGTYTITNIGSFGNILGTPIINQPQVAIMAIGSIEKKPAVIETENGDLIGIRHKMYLSHAYDHRVVDGALGGMFVKKVSDYLENFNLKTEI